MNMKKKFGLILFSFLTIFLGMIKVDAATFTKGSNTQIWYVSYNYTYYNKQIDGTVAYCIQMNRSVPYSGYSGYSSGWSKYKYDAYVSAQIVKIGKSKYTGTTQYLYIQEALNCYKSYSGAYLGACGNSSITSLISSAKTAVSKYKYTSGSSKSSLPKINLETSDSTLSNSGNMGNYVSSKIDLKGIVKTYGGTSYEKVAPSYKITLTSSAEDSLAYICSTNTYSDSTCSTDATVTNVEDYSFYVYLKNGGIDGGNVQINVSGNNSSSYPSSYLWIPSNEAYQRMVTYTTVTIKRTISTSLTLNYSKVNYYSASLKKVDENGEDLKGANLTLYTASDKEGKNKIKELCTISGDATSCSNNNLSTVDQSYGYKTGNYLCYIESTEPSGYKKIDTVCNEIKVGTTQDLYYVGSKAISLEIYQKYVGAGNYCITNTEDNFDVTYISSVLAKGIENNDSLTSGNCESVDVSSGDSNGGSSEGSGSSEGEGSGTEPVVTNYKKSICVAGDNTYDETGEYCLEHDPLSYYQQLNGDSHIIVTNALNVLNISKKAITGDDEVPGATLAIYTTDNSGKCTNVLAKAKRFDFQEYTYAAPEEGDKVEESDNTNIRVEEDKEGDANLGKEESDASEDTTEISVTEGLKWVSSNTPAIVSGLDSGTYCLIEELAPKGYKKVTSTTKFTMSSDGSVKLVENADGAADLKDDENGTSTLTLHDTLIEVTISKDDIATSKELPGATLAICTAGKDENGEYTMSVNNLGECSTVSLADGSLATWVSTDKPHIVSGLGAGTYYLVEQTAPNGYSTAESILFVVKEDGTLTDINGKALSEGKLVMHDKAIGETKTGMIGIYVLSGILLISVSLGIVSYINLRKRSKEEIFVNGKKDK